MRRISSDSRAMVGFCKTSAREPCSMNSMISCGTDPFSITAPMIVIIFGWRRWVRVFISSMKSDLVHDRFFLKDEDDFGAVGQVLSDESIKRFSTDAVKVLNFADCTIDASMQTSSSSIPSLLSVSVAPLLVDNPSSTSGPGILSGAADGAFSWDGSPFLKWELFLLASLDWYARFTATLDPRNSACSTKPKDPCPTTTRGLGK
mmetsp:Transcript_9882/g.23349  ORF Transcript_9882/g.23349 Transcript_9882/m.23349 type:complete len:204 (+) Transcript_9882:695-1306(+)